MSGRLRFLTVYSEREAYFCRLM
uniref:Uncharacterized protein n=1 Tax=Anguilla anguilla TaxID=7936 RepID=A0A0E9T4F7_ANGAN